MASESLIEGAFIVNSATERPQTPTLHTPPGSKTPSTIHSRRVLGNGEGAADFISRATDGMEAEALSKRLKEIEHAGKQRERTPGRSPSRKRQRVYGDR